MEIDLILSSERTSFNPEKHYWGKPCIRGHVNPEGETWRSRNGGACVLCKREIALAWRNDNPERAKANTTRRDKRRVHSDRRKRWPFALHLGSVAKRCRNRGIPIGITPDDMRVLWREQGGLCYWTAQPLDFNVGSARGPFRPSLDRLVPELGYVVGNVVWASNFANRARGNATVDEFKAILQRFGIKGLF